MNIFKLAEELADRRLSREVLEEYPASEIYEWNKEDFHGSHPIPVLKDKWQATWETYFDEYYMYLKNRYGLSSGDQTKVDKRKDTGKNITS